MIDLVLVIVLSAIVGAMVILPFWAAWFALRWIIGFLNEWRDLPEEE